VGTDGQKANATYTLQTTPPDGTYLNSGSRLSYEGLGFPMEQKIAYWKGVYFFTFVASTARSEFVAFLPLYYFSGWTASQMSDLGPVPFFGQDLAIAQGSSNLLLKAAVPYSGPELCYGTGVIAGTSASWLYTGTGCEGLETPTAYDVVDHASALIDDSGNWWAAVETQDSQRDAHLEVLMASNGAWSEVYVSPPFASGSNPVPELLQLKDGKIVVLYSLASGSSDCTGGDYFLYTDDGGYSWSRVMGPFSVLGALLCYDKSSGAVVGDTLYAGGVDAAGALGYWSYNFDDNSSSARTLLGGVSYAAMGSTGSTLTLSYTTAVSCEGQNSLHLMWSYDGGEQWNDSGSIGCVHDYVVLASSLSTFQVAILSDVQVAGGLSPEYIFYTV
jgi:hypothetical protein